MTLKPRLLSEIASRFAEPIDLFLCAASFESRCLSVSTHMDPNVVRRTVIVANITCKAEISSNRASLKTLWGGEAEEVDVSSDDPVQSFDNLFSCLSADCGESARRVLIDITTLTHEMVMMLCHICTVAFNDHDHVEFIYATASDYSLGQLKASKWLSKGIKEIRSVIGYPGRLMPSKSNHLIILVGFEEVRALSVIREFEPSLISIGYGDRSEESTGPHQETNETKVRRLRSLVGAVNEFVFSCYDPVSACDTLESLLSDRPQYNHIVAPMNTKLSTVGAALCAGRNDAVQLCYAQPEIYNIEEYSAPGTHFYCVEFREFLKG